MSLALVQSKTATFSGAGGTSLSFDSAPAAGHLRIAVLIERSSIGAPRTGPSGWLRADGAGTDASEGMTVWYSNDGTASAVSVGGATNGRRLIIAEFAGRGTLVDVAEATQQASSTSHAAGSATVDVAGLMVGAAICDDFGAPGGLNPTFTDDGLYTTIASGLVHGSAAPAGIASFREVGAGTYSYTPTTDFAGRWGAVLLAFEGLSPFTADFEADTTGGVAPQTVNFTDLSAGGSGPATAWAWDFGDGGTSTSQDPTHAYTVPGVYTVSLVATNVDGSDTETKLAYIQVDLDVGYTAPDPASALLEIFAAAPGSSRWGVALWGQGRWSSAGWRDVTPQGIDVAITWGSSQPELGILSKPDAETWQVHLYDPERLLDPANAGTTYHADLVPGLPIRLSHRGVVVRTGIAESIGYAHRDQRGLIRATGNQSRLANSMIPEASTLSDTLRARARDVIAVAGLPITVEPDPPSGDPAVAPRLDGERSAWRHIADAAEQALHIPFIDRDGRLGFRAWAVPLVRGRDLSSPELLDLLAISADAGLYSVVQAQQTVADGGAVVERRLTPVPRYGPRTFARSDPTIAAGAWADAVLAERAWPTIRWVPGDMQAWTAADVERLATIEAIEQVTISYAEADPPIIAGAIVVGGEVSVRGQRDDSAVWSFRFEAAAAALEPLIETGGDPTDYLLATGGGEFLYPTT